MGDALSLDGRINRYGTHVYRSSTARGTSSGPSLMGMVASRTGRDVGFRDYRAQRQLVSNVSRRDADRPTAIL